MKTTFNTTAALKKIIFFCFILISLNSNGQQLYYSQYQLTPMLNNPSLISLTEEIKVDLGYRNQFGGKGSNYATPLFSAFMPFYQEVGRDVFKKFGSAGIQVYTDRTGFSGMLATSGFSVTYAHIVKISRSNWISLGIQPGVYQRKVDFSQLTSGSQWDGFQGTYVGGDLGENISASERRNFFTMNSGITYVNENSRGDQFLVLAVGANNLTRPNISLNAKTFSNPINWNIQGTILAFENNEFQVKPSVRHIQARNVNQTNIGSQVFYKIKDKKGFFTKGNIGLGVWYSNQNAIITAFEINQKDWALGFSYDFLASTLADANNSMGAPEIIIGFRKFIGKGRKGVSDINADGSSGGGGKSGGSLRDPKKGVPTPTEITPEPEAKPGDGKAGEDNKPAIDRELNDKKDGQQNIDTKPKEVENASDAPVQPKAKDEKPKATGADKSSTVKPSNEAKSAKPVLQSNLSPELTEKLSKVLTPDKELGKDPYAGTKLALTKKEREIFRQQPRYVKGDTKIDEVTQAQLKKIAKMMKSRPKLKLEINGFACNLGTKEVNAVISKGRAETVKKFLQQNGISPKRLKTVGNGYESPIGDNSTEEGKVTNRRVQFKFVK